MNICLQVCLLMMTMNFMFVYDTVCISNGEYPSSFLLIPVNPTPNSHKSLLTWNIKKNPQAQLSLENFWKSFPPSCDPRCAKY